MSTYKFCSGSAATIPASEYMRARRGTAPLAAHVLWSDAALTTVGNPTLGTDVTIVSRVRDAKQAAPPRGELH